MGWQNSSMMVEPSPFPRIFLDSVRGKGSGRLYRPALFSDSRRACSFSSFREIISSQKRRKAFHDLSLPIIAARSREREVPANHCGEDPALGCSRRALLRSVLRRDLCCTVMTQRRALSLDTTGNFRSNCVPSAPPSPGTRKPRPMPALARRGWTASCRPDPAEIINPTRRPGTLSSVDPHFSNDPGGPRCHVLAPRRRLLTSSYISMNIEATSTRRDCPARTVAST